jgi:hypothetical protein
MGGLFAVEPHDGESLGKAIRNRIAEIAVATRDEDDLLSFAHVAPFGRSGAVAARAPFSRAAYSIPKINLYTHTLSDASRLCGVNLLAPFRRVHFLDELVEPGIYFGYHLLMPGLTGCGATN